MRWSGAPLVGARLVVVAPHPDDEVLAAGGLMRWTARCHREVVIVAVTDGEASYLAADDRTTIDLRERRARERAEALCRLGVPEVTLHRLRWPDRHCADAVDDIAADLLAVVRSGDLVVGPSTQDRHPDHVAVAAATRAAAVDVVDTVWEAPTWALVHGTAESPTAALELDDDAWLAKQHAVAAFRSQLEPFGIDRTDGPVVHPHELATMLTRCEGFLAVPVGA